MAEVYVKIILDIENWQDPDDPMPISVVYNEGLSTESVIELLRSALLGLENPSFMTEVSYSR